MKIRAQSFLASGLAAVLAVSLQGVPDAGADSADQAIRSAYETLQTALFKNDASAIAPLLATNFQSRHVDGSTEDRDAYLKNATESYSSPDLTLSSLTIAITKLDVTGQTAQAEVQYEVTGTYAVKGVAKPFRGMERETDRWTHEGGQWKLLSTTAHEMLSYVDGKLVQNDREEPEQLPPTSAAIAELRARAVVIPTLDLDADPQQFTAIGAAIGDARIVGMGEGSHGSREFFAFKNRLFKYLVENKGFTVFGMEAVWGGGRAVDRYIKGGPGTAQQAVAALEFWDWNTPEVVDLVQWMRDYNGRPGRHPMLSFAGFDMQDPMGPAGYLIEFFRAHDAGMAQNAQSALSCIGEIVSAIYLALPGKTPITGCQRKVVALNDRLATLSGTPDFDVTRSALTNVQEFFDSQAAPSAAAVRDRDMAENVEWLATNEYPRAKIALWAHNYHIGSAVSEDLNVNPSMGTYLRKRFGADYYTIGQTFGSGSVRVNVQGRGLQSVTVPAKPGDSIPALFGPLKAIALLDLRGLNQGGALRAYFAQEHVIEGIGGGASPQGDVGGRVQIVIPNAYDGLVYVPTSTAAIYGTPPWQWRRDVRENGQPWVAAGAGFYDVAISGIANGAVLSNNDGLNAMVNELSRRFDATPYLGRTVRVTGEARRVNLFGFAFPFIQALATSGRTAGETLGTAIKAQAGDAWVPFVLNMSLPRNARYIEAGVASAGLGSAEVRNVAIGN